MQRSAFLRLQRLQASGFSVFGFSRDSRNFSASRIQNVGFLV